VALEARVAWLLVVLDALEERLKGTVKPGEHVLQDLRMDTRYSGRNSLMADSWVLWPARVTLTPHCSRTAPALLPHCSRTAPALLPRFFAFLQGGVLEFAAVAYNKRQHQLLLSSGFEVVFEGLLHTAYALFVQLIQTQLICLIGTKSASLEGHSPRLKDGGVLTTLFKRMRRVAQALDVLMSSFA